MKTLEDKDEEIKEKKPRTNKYIKFDPILPGLITQRIENKYTSLKQGQKYTSETRNSHK